MKEILRTIGGAQGGAKNGKQPVTIGQLKKKTERIDGYGNIIDPESKEIIRGAEESPTI